MNSCILIKLLNINCQIFNILFISTNQETHYKDDPNSNIG